MNTLLKFRRLTRKRAYLSHKKEWYIIDGLVAVVVSSMIMFTYNAIVNGINPWL
jgi:hypothetical protein